MRQPWNVFVYTYRKIKEDYEYLLLKRHDDGIWQGAAGGGEDGELPIEAAHREAYEEVALPREIKLQRLDTMSYMEKKLFTDNDKWGNDIFVIPMYYYASEYDGDIVLSSEHSEYGWFDFEDAMKKLYWHDNKTALWELNERLKKGKNNGL